MVARVPFTLRCCLCQKLIPARADAFLLDIEWQRRFPAMEGRLACFGCAVRDNYWKCLDEDVYSAGHIPALRDPGSTRPDHDSWSHIVSEGPAHTMCIGYPDAAARQGAEEYLRHIWKDPRTAAATRQRLSSFLGMDVALSPLRSPPTDGQVAGNSILPASR